MLQYKLCLTIAQYKEPEEQIGLMLDSINIQQGVDFSEIDVVIVNDGSDVLLSDVFLKSYKNIKNLRYIKNKKNIGLGLTRQRGLDECRSEYIMFLDSDDCFISGVALHTIMTALDANKPEILLTTWLEEREQGGKPVFIIKNNEMTWCHGKVFSVDFLRKNKLVFHKELRVHEDTYFVGLACELAQNMIRIDFVSFLWKLNKNSMVRGNDGAYQYEALPVFMRAVELLIERLESEKQPEENIVNRIVHFMLIVYFNLQMPVFKEERAKQSIIESEKKYRLLLKKYHLHLEKQFNSGSFASKYNTARDRVLSSDYMERESFADFIKRLSI